MEQKTPLVCRIFGHKWTTWLNTSWNGVWVWERYCMRDCPEYHRVGEVEFQRKWLGR